MPAWSETVRVPQLQLHHSSHINGATYEYHWFWWKWCGFFFFFFKWCVFLSLVNSPCACCRTWSSPVPEMMELQSTSLWFTIRSNSRAGSRPSRWESAEFVLLQFCYTDLNPKWKVQTSPDAFIFLRIIECAYSMQKDRAFILSGSAESRKRMKPRLRSSESAAAVGSAFCFSLLLEFHLFHLLLYNCLANSS